VFPAASQRLRRAAYDARWLAVGDAALAVDPISGSGVVRALQTAHAAATTVIAILTGDESRPIAAYEAELDRECTQYLRERAQYYGAERRWDSAPFWRRRIAVPQVGDSLIAGQDHVSVQPLTGLVIMPRGHSPRRIS
jgi:flavin-dependent dehydrogenase